MTIKLHPNAHDLTGQVFGELTALRPVGRRGNSIEWECSCSCGRRKALRSCNQLMTSRRQGTEPCCQLCLEELRGGYFEQFRREAEERRQGRVRHYRKIWMEEGSLWDVGAVDHLMRAVASDLYRETLVVPDDPYVVDLQRQFRHGTARAESLGHWIGPVYYRDHGPSDDYDEDALPGTEQGSYEPYRMAEEKERNELADAIERHQQFLDRRTEEEEESPPRRASLARFVWWGEEEG